MTEPAYTPRAEYNCDTSTTHYQGCKCHEARRNAELAALREAAEKAQMTIRHALHLGYMGEGSTKGMADSALSALDAVLGEKS